MKGLLCSDALIPSSPESAAKNLRTARAIIQRDLAPHSYVSMGDVLMISPITAVNDAGLIVANASGHPKFNFSNNPETVNIYFWTSNNCPVLHRLLRCLQSCKLNIAAAA